MNINIYYKTIILFIFYIFFLPKSYLFAHPHVFVMAKFYPEINKNQINALNFKLVFDNMFSSNIKIQYDINKNNIIDNNEIINLKKDVKYDLDQDKYWIYIFNKEGNISNFNIYNTDISFNKNNLFSISFSLDLKNLLRYNPEIYISCFDTSFYSFVLVDENSLVFSDNKPHKAIKFINEPGQDIFGGEFIPYALHITQPAEKVHSTPTRPRSAMAAEPGSPFGRTVPSNVANSGSSNLSSPNWYTKWLVKISRWQKRFRSLLSARAEKIKTNPFGPSFWSFLGLIFAYGVLHALGPGHGKGFACAYFASRPAQMWQGVFLGAIMPFIHVFSATVLVMGFYWLFDSSSMGLIANKSQVLQQISYGLLALLGICLTVHALIDLKSKTDSKCESAQMGSMLGLALAVGLVPCPGAAIILIFCITLNIVGTGLVGMFFLAAGMALTITTFSMLTIFSHNGLSCIGSRYKKYLGTIHHLLSLCGALAITGMAILLFMTS